VSIKGLRCGCIGTEIASCLRASLLAQNSFWSSHAGLGKVRVDIGSFFEFSFWMAEELEDLIGQMGIRAAPNASNAKKRIASDASRE